MLRVREFTDLGSQRTKAKKKLSGTALKKMTAYLQMKFPGPPPVTNIRNISAHAVHPSLEGEFADYLLSDNCPRVNKYTTVVNYVSQVHCEFSDAFPAKVDTSGWVKHYKQLMDNIFEHFAQKSADTGE